MPNDNCQKIKLLKLMELLRRDTDEDHPITTSEICRRLGEMGISCERRTVGKDMKLLREQGYEIMSELSGHENSYWIADRSFSLPELKILMDAVQAAHFIPPDKTEELVAKIAALGGSHQSELLQGNLVRFTARKHSNHSIFYNVQEIETAIQHEQTVSFRYFDLDEKMERIYRGNARRYHVEPLTLVYEDNNYYMLTYSAKYDHLTPYRVDRMDRVQVEESPLSKTALEKKENSKIAVEQASRMFMGKTRSITLEFSDQLIGTMFDKFGEDLKIERVNADLCRAPVEIQISPTFWSWLFLYPGEIRVVKQKELVEQYVKRLRDALSNVETITERQGGYLRHPACRGQQSSE